MMSDINKVAKVFEEQLYGKELDNEVSMSKALRWAILGGAISGLVVILLLTGCGEPAAPVAPVAKVIVHVYTKDGAAVWCPEELDPVPTTWEYNGTAEVDADHEDVLSQCELE